MNHVSFLGVVAGGPLGRFFLFEEAWLFFCAAAGSFRLRKMFFKRARPTCDVHII